MSTFNEYLIQMAQYALGESNTAIRTIDAAHQRTHEGEMFVVGYRWEGSADNATVSLSLTIPTGVSAHTIWEVGSTGKSYLDVFRGSTVTGGTAMTPTNKNRSSTKATTVTVIRDGTISATGTLMFPDLIGSGAKGTVGGTGGVSYEFVLNAGEQYLFRLQNKAGAVADMAMNIQFYDTAAA